MNANRPINDPLPALPVHDPAADAWRAMARLVAWVGVVNSGCSLIWFIADSFGPATAIRAVWDVVSNASGARISNILLAIQEWLGFMLMIVLLMGSMATLLHRRWGPSVLLGYSFAAVGATALLIAWFVDSYVENRSAFQQAHITLASNVANFLIVAVRDLTFPLIAFVVMRHPAVRGQAVSGRAFEPLPAARLASAEPVRT
ncbi:MAG TPA: hypothetical protein VH475_21405 [Tepidisphaeraceae bacterium]|jgi:hypothetical protein